MPAKKRAPSGDYVFPITIARDGKEIPPGEPVTLSDEEAAVLCPLHGGHPAEAAKQAEPQKPQKPSGDELVKAIAEKITHLDPKNEEHFTQGGKPGVAVLEKMLGYDITYEDRDKAVELLIEKPDLFAPAK